MSREENWIKELDTYTKPELRNFNTTRNEATPWKGDFANLERPNNNKYKKKLTV